MKNRNSVFIATSLDGFIADKDGRLDWLHAIPNPDQNDMGYARFMAQTDALIMGRKTFETVAGFDVDWPYTVPVFVLSHTMTAIPPKFDGKVFLMKGEVKRVLDEIYKKGFHRLYIDGGKLIQSFLREDLIDEMIITIIPTILGGGTSLFAHLDKPIHFECVNTCIYLDKIVQNHFVRLPRT